MPCLLLSPYLASRGPFLRGVSEQFYCLVASDGFGVGVFGDFGVFAAVGNVWTEAAVEYLDAVAKVSDIFLGLGFELGSV